VAPIVENSTVVRTINFPNGEDYVDWWNSSKVYQGGSEVDYPIPMDRFPVFHRKGSMLPLHVVNDLGVRHGDERSSGSLTLLIKYLSGDGVIVGTAVREWKGLSQEFEYVWHKGDDQKRDFGWMELKATAHERNLIVLIHGVKMSEESEVIFKIEDEAFGGGRKKLEKRNSVDELHDKKYGWTFDREREELWVKPGDSSLGLELIVKGIKNAR